MAAVVHLVDVTPVWAEIGEIFVIVAHDSLRRRAIQLAGKAAMTDPRNAQPVGKKALKTAPDWALARVARGDAVHRFRLWAANRAQLRRLAENLAHVATLITHAPPGLGGRTLHAEACELSLSCERMSLEDLALVAAQLARRRREVDAEALLLAALLSCPPIDATGARVWRPLREKAALWAVGATLGNCLKEGSCFAQGYETQLEEEDSYFYALCDAERVLAAVQVKARTRTIVQFKARHNTRADAYGADLVMLMAAEGYLAPCESLGQRTAIDATTYERCFVLSARL